MKPSLKGAVLANCHQCMGGYSDGKQDCQCIKCPFYYWMPYREMEPDMGWVTVNPKRKGFIEKGQGGRVFSEEEKRAFVERVSTRKEQMAPIMRAPVVRTPQ